MNVIVRSPGNQLEELEEVVLECPGLTWNQVFCDLDRLSLAGQVQLTKKVPASMRSQTQSRAIYLSSETEKRNRIIQPQAPKEPRRRKGSQTVLESEPLVLEEEAVHTQLVSPSDDLQACITSRAYELYAERGYR